MATATMPENMTLERRYIWFGLKSAIKWMSNPVSEKGATQVARVKLSLGGPDVLKDIEKMRNHPVGSRLLAEKPDLGEAFDMENLAKMPEGSFGRKMHDILDHPDTIPGYLLAGLAYRDGFFDSIQMDEDVRWFLERSFFDHDASHVISGYDTDLAGEALDIYFVMGYQTNLPKWLAFMNPFGLIALFIRPKVGTRAWLKHLSTAFDRGRVARNHFPPHSIPYEELLEKPLEEARAFLGIAPLPDGWDTSDWLVNNKRAESIVNSHNEGDRANKTDPKLAQKVIELTGSKSEIIYEAMPQDDPKQRQPDISHAQNTLGWAPEIQLEQGLNRTIAYFEKLLPDLTAA